MAAAADLGKSPSPLFGKEPREGKIRLASLDAYRGLVMFLMMAEVLRLGAMAKNFPQSGFWNFLAFHQSHVDWTGCSLHDLIQPSFSFLVGVSLPFSLAARRQRGQSTLWMLLHAVLRAVVLILLGVFLRSLSARQTNWTLEDTLSQIGMGYVFLFLLALAPPRVQWGGLAVVLFGYWLAFAAYPLPPEDFNYPAVGVKEDWPHHAQGFAAHWNKNSNLAWAFDRWFLNLLPRPKPWEYNGGGYATLSFIPTLGTMLLGLLAGERLRSDESREKRTTWLLAVGAAAFALGLLLHVLGICPAVKRIWTPSWTLVSGGACCWFLAAFYWLIDERGWRAWSFPLIVIGANSIAAYVIAETLGGFIENSLKIHFGENVFGRGGKDYEPLVRGGSILLVYWLSLFWMYRQKIFVKI